MKILEFQTHEEAEACLSIIEADLFLHQSCHMNTGQKRTLEVSTKCWALIYESPRKTFYFTSPAGDKRLCHTLLKCAHINFVERDLPSQWVDHEGEPKGFAASLQIFAKRVIGVFRGLGDQNPRSSH